MALAKLQRRNRINRKSVYLNEYAENITSQCGEDGIIQKIISLMPPLNKWCVELGAWNGHQHSNTWNLINNLDWEGVLIEGKADRFDELSNRYSRNSKAHLDNTYVRAGGGIDSLDQVLSKHEVPDNFDLLSIDVDGPDWHLWSSLRDFNPRLVVIEFNPTIPNYVYFVQDNDSSVNQGSSLLAMIELGKQKGYELIATTAWNAFFVRDEEFPRFGISDNDIDAMHDCGKFQSTFFQLFDGTLVLMGCTKLLWHGISLTQEDIQVLPASLRRFQD